MSICILIFTHIATYPSPPQGPPTHWSSPNESWKTYRSQKHCTYHTGPLFPSRHALWTVALDARNRIKELEMRLVRGVLACLKPLSVYFCSSFDTITLYPGPYPSPCIESMSFLGFQVILTLAHMQTGCFATEFVSTPRLGA